MNQQSEQALTYRLAHHIEVDERFMSYVRRFGESIGLTKSVKRTSATILRSTPGGSPRVQGALHRSSGWLLLLPAVTTLHMFERCQNCRSRVVFGYRNTTGVFCSSVCHNYHANPGFCEICLSQTVEIGAGDTTVRGIGTSLCGSSEPCPRCGSVIRRLCDCFFFYSSHSARPVSSKILCAPANTSADVSEHHTEAVTPSHYT